mgnify:CR=1 FL=1
MYYIDNTMMTIGVTCRWLYLQYDGAKKESSQTGSFLTTMNESDRDEAPSLLIPFLRPGMMPDYVDEVCAVHTAY